MRRRVSKQASCEIKTAYETFEEARRVLRKMVRNWRIKGMKPYRCRYCRFWHIGHSLVEVKPSDKSDKSIRRKAKGKAKPRR